MSPKSWPEIEAELRPTIDDVPEPGVEPDFSSEELLGYLGDFLRDLAAEFPKRESFTVAVSAGTASYTLDPRIVRIEAVESAARARLLAPLALRGSHALRLPDDSYQWFGGQLRLHPLPTAADTLTIYAHTLYQEPAGVDDPAPLDVPLAAYSAMRYYLRYAALEREATQRADLAQWENSERNPLQEMASTLYKRYRQQVERLRFYPHLS